MKLKYKASQATHNIPHNIGVRSTSARPTTLDHRAQKVSRDDPFDHGEMTEPPVGTILRSAAIRMSSCSWACRRKRLKDDRQRVAAELLNQ